MFDKGVLYMAEKKEAIERTIYLKEREIELVCPICGGKMFYDRKTLMNTMGMTFMGYDWLNAEATNYICSDCSYIYWFMYDVAKKPKEEPELTPVQRYEKQFEESSDTVLYKILYGGEYEEDKRIAAKNILRRRGVKV